MNLALYICGLHSFGFFSVLLILHFPEFLANAMFFLPFSLYCFHFQQCVLPFIMFFGAVFLDRKISFSEYTLTKDRVKLIRGKNLVAEEAAFQLLPNSEGVNSDFPPDNSFLTFDENLDGALEFAYEMNLCGKKLSYSLYVFTRQPVSEDVLDSRVHSIIAAFNLNSDYQRSSFEVLENVFLNIIGGKYFTRIRKIKGERNVLLLEQEGENTYLAVLVLKGAPDYESLNPEYINLFVECVQNIDADVSLVVPFRFITVCESESRVKKDLKICVRVNGRPPVKFFEVSPYLVVRAPTLESIKNHMKRVYTAACAAWSGTKKVTSVEFLDSEKTKKLLHNIICRLLLPEREIYRFKNLCVYLRTVARRLESETPAAITKENEKRKEEILDSYNNRIPLGETMQNGRPLPVCLDYSDFSNCMVIFGESPRKIRFLLGLLKKITKPWIVFDLEGELCKLRDSFRDSVSFFTPLSELEPLRINIFDPLEKSPDEHASFLISVFEKILETDFGPVEKPLHGILSHFCDKRRCSQGLSELNIAFDEILKWSASKKRSAIGELATLLRSLLHGLLGEVFGSGQPSVDLRKMTEKCVVIDLNRILPRTNPRELKFLLTLILMYILDNTPRVGGGIKHVTVINCHENCSELINFLTKKLFDESTKPVGEGLILTVSHPQNLKSIRRLDSYYRIIFSSSRNVEKAAEILGISPETIENLGDMALMIIPETEKQVTFHPHLIDSVRPKASAFHTRDDKLTVTPRVDGYPKRPLENWENLYSKNSSSPLSGDFVTADAFLKGLPISGKARFEPPSGLSREQIDAFVDKVLLTLENEVYLTDIHISQLTGIPPDTVNKIMREALSVNSEIQRIYVPVVGSRNNIPLYYSKFGPKYENVQDKYLKDLLEELCFKTGTKLSMKKDLETGADGQIESYTLKLFVHIPKENELKNTLQKLFMRFNRVAVLFLHDKDLEKAQKLNSSWRIPLIMDCLRNLDTFLTEVRLASREKTLKHTYPSEEDLQELISWLEADA